MLQQIKTWATAAPWRGFALWQALLFDGAALFCLWRGGLTVQNYGAVLFNISAVILILGCGAGMSGHSYIIPSAPTAEERRRRTFTDVDKMWHVRDHVYNTSFGIALLGLPPLLVSLGLGFWR
jgi:hypothetical protein